MMEKEEKKIYEPPQADIVEFEMKEHIASSADNGASTICSESIFD